MYINSIIFIEKCQIPGIISIVYYIYMINRLICYVLLAVSPQKIIFISLFEASLKKPL